MNRLKAILLGIAFTIATIFVGGWLATNKQNPSTRIPNQVKTLPEQSASESKPILNTQQTDNREPEPTSITVRRQHIANQLGLGAETEMVHGIEVRKDRNCTVRIHYIDNGDGTTRVAHSCEPDDPAEQDIYDTYATAELEALAYNDSHAAHVLSKRLNKSDHARALEYAIRASALDDNSPALLWSLANHPIPYKKNNVVQVRSVEDKYVLSAVANARNGTLDVHELYLTQAQQHQANGVDIDELDRRVDEILAEIERIKSEVGVVRNTTH